MTELDRFPERLAARDRATVAADGLEAIPEGWVPLGNRHCSVSDGVRCVLARLARTPQTLELRLEDGPRLHAWVTDIGVPGMVAIHARPCDSLPAGIGPQVWSVRRSGGTVMFERADRLAALSLRQVAPERLQLDVYGGSGARGSYLLTT